MNKFAKFINHNLGRTMYVVCVFPSKVVKMMKIDKGDNVVFGDNFVSNTTKKWGTEFNFIVDVVVSMTGVVSF